MWSPLMCVVGMRVGAVRLTAGCVQWFTIRILKVPKRKLQPASEPPNSVKEPNNSGLPFETHHNIMNHWAANHEGSEKRQRWIDRERELGFLDYL